MPGPRSLDFPPAAWSRFGKAVARARRAIGHTSAESFAAEVGKSLRSIQAVEAGEGAGVAILEAIGQALGKHLREWDVDTPQSILEGGPIPGLELVDPAKPAKARLDVVWHKALEEFTVVFQSREDANTLLRKLQRWRGPFAKVGFTDSDLLEVVERAREAAARADG